MSRRYAHSNGFAFVLVSLAAVSTPLALTGCGSSSNSTNTGDAASTGGDDGSTTTSGGSDGATSATDSGAPATDGSTTTTTSDSGATTAHDAAADTSGGGHAIKNVFIIMMENHSWDLIKGNGSAPYINGLLSKGAHAENYQNILHPSEPNYLYLEAGDNLGVFDDNPPSINSQSTKDHLAAYLEKAGLDWRAWQEDIDGTTCPLTDVALYAPKHNPFVFFDDMTDSGSSSSAHCISHVRPYGELAAALSAGTAPAYNFITPNLVNDMHDGGTSGSIPVGDAWLAKEVPKILASAQYKAGGLLIILWDEAENGSTPYVPCVVLSPFIKAGYSSTTKYTHASVLRTVEEIFSLSPLLGGAASANSLKDMFTTYP